MKGLLDKHFEEIDKKYHDLCAKGPLIKALLGKPPTKEESVKMFAGILPDKTLGREYLERRAVVLNMHFWADFFINRTLAYHYLRELDSSRAEAFQREVLSELNAISKADILSEHDLCRGPILEKYRALNRVRNALAHHSPKDHPKMKYQGKSIFLEGVLERMWKDVEDFIEENMVSVLNMRRRHGAPSAA